MNCAHLDVSDEAVGINAFTGQQIKTTVHLCGWLDMHPERMIDAPRWLMKQSRAGWAVDPKRDCKGCPGYAAHLPKD